MNEPEYKAILDNYIKLTESSLATLVDGYPDSVVAEAMRYSLLGGGKRIRAVLTLASARLCGSNDRDAVDAACAVEMVHAYSLIHDDLPCMDDDDMRRGKPSCHKAFGEANALLAGDALVTLAFSALTGIENAEVSRECVSILASAAGHKGMIYGQELDLMTEDGRHIGEDELKLLQSKKTGELIKAAVMMGAAVAGADDDKRAALAEYAKNLGRVFQIVDDILDCTANEAELGKPVGSDAKNGKTTYATLFGLDTSRELASKYNERAKGALAGAFSNDAGFLAALADELLVRAK